MTDMTVITMSQHLRDDRIQITVGGFGRGLHGDEHVDHDSGDDLEDHGGYAIT